MAEPHIDRRATEDSAASAAVASASTAAAASKPKLHIVFPPTKEQSEILDGARAAVDQAEIREDISNEMPPVIRSVLELSHLVMSGHSQWLRGAPGYQGGIFYKGKPFCFASGYRDTGRPLDYEDKGNHVKLKDPFVYGTLTLPITAAYLCDLHGRQIFDLERPLVDYLPELGGKLTAAVTARSILSFTHGIEDAALFRDAGARAWRLPLSRDMCAATQKRLYDPVTRFLAGGAKTATPLTGQEQRANLIQYIRSSPRITRNFACSMSRARISHCSVALLVAAVESQLKGRSFEAEMREGFFERAQSYGTGYGAPTLWKDPKELFYQPTGQSLQYTGFKSPVPIGSPLNCAPAVFNGSLNLYAPCEDFGKLLLLAVDTIMDARELLGTPANADASPYYDFGVLYDPKKKELRLTKKVFSATDALPTAASFRYSCEHDLGCFGIASCGSRNGRFFANNLSAMVQHLFVKHVLSKGINPETPMNLDNPAQAKEQTDTAVSRVLEKQKYTNIFTKYDQHTRL